MREPEDTPSRLLIGLPRVEIVGVSGDRGMRPALVLGPEIVDAEQFAAVMDELRRRIHVLRQKALEHHRRTGLRAMSAAESASLAARLNRHEEWLTSRLTKLRDELAAE